MQYIPMSSSTWQDCFSLLLVIKFHNTGISPDRTRQKRRNYAKTAYLITICYTTNIGCRFCRNCGLMPKQNSLQRLGDNKIQAKQNHVFASVTYKIRRADFPNEWGQPNEWGGKRWSFASNAKAQYFTTCRKTRGKPQRSVLGLPYAIAKW